MKSTIRILLASSLFLVPACGGAASSGESSTPSEETSASASTSTAGASLHLTGNRFGDATLSGAIRPVWPQSYIDTETNTINVVFSTGPAETDVAGVFVTLPELAPGTYVQNPDADEEPVSISFQTPSASNPAVAESIGIFDATLVIEEVDVATRRVRFHFEGNSAPSIAGGVVHAVANVDGTLGSADE